MDTNKRSEHRPKKRVQFGIRSLLLTMAVLGPISGWYGPEFASRALDYLSGESSAEYQAMLKQQAAAKRYRQQVIAMQNKVAQMLQRSEQREQELRDRASLEYNLPTDLNGPLINSDRTFSMRFHDPSMTTEVDVADDEI